MYLEARTGWIVMGDETGSGSDIQRCLAQEGFVMVRDPGSEIERHFARDGIENGTTIECNQD